MLDQFDMPLLRVDNELPTADMEKDKKIYIEANTEKFDDSDLAHKQHTVDTREDQRPVLLHEERDKIELLRHEKRERTGSVSGPEREDSGKEEDASRVSVDDKKKKRDRGATAQFFDELRKGSRVFSKRAGEEREFDLTKGDDQKEVLVDKRNVSKPEKKEKDKDRSRRSGSPRKNDEESDKAEVKKLNKVEDKEREKDKKKRDATASSKSGSEDETERDKKSIGKMERKKSKEKIRKPDGIKTITFAEKEKEREKERGERDRERERERERQKVSLSFSGKKRTSSSEVLAFTCKKLLYETQNTMFSVFFLKKLY